MKEKTIPYIHGIYLNLNFIENSNKITNEFYSDVILNDDDFSLIDKYLTILIYLIILLLMKVSDILYGLHLIQ